MGSRKKFGEVIEILFEMMDFMKYVPRSMADIAEHFERPKASVYNHVQTLIRIKWIKCVGEQVVGRGKPTKFYVAIKIITVEPRRGRLPMIPGIIKKKVDKSKKVPGRRGRPPKKKDVIPEDDDVSITIDKTEPVDIRKDFVPTDKKKITPIVEEKFVPEDLLLKDVNECSFVRYLLFHNGATLVKLSKYLRLTYSQTERIAGNLSGRGVVRTSGSQYITVSPKEKIGQIRVG